MIFALSLLACGVVIASLSNLSLWVERWHIRRERETEEDEAADDRAAPPPIVSETIASVQTRIALANKIEEEHRAKERRYWRKQLIEARRLNFITGFGTVAAGVGLLFVWQPLKESKDATIENNRAWITPGAISFVRDLSGKPLYSVQIMYGNIGHSPVINVQNYTFFATIPESKAVDRAPSGFIPPAIMAAGCDANVKPQFSVAYPDNGKSLAITPETPSLDVASIKAVKSTMYVYGCFKYQTFGQMHYSFFCQYLDPDLFTPYTSWDFRICPTANYAD